MRLLSAAFGTMVFRRLRRPGFFASALIVAGCTTSPSAPLAARIDDTTSLPQADERVQRDVAAIPQTHHASFQTGLASWYGKKFQGRRTASGERLDVNRMTAAHRTLPLGSWVRVSIPGANRAVDVRINDRGPFTHNRIIDLSYGAAFALGITHRGIAKVELSRLDGPPSTN